MYTRRHLVNTRSTSGRHPVDRNPPFFSELVYAELNFLTELCRSLSDRVSVLRQNEGFCRLQQELYSNTTAVLYVSRSTLARLQICSYSCTRDPYSAHTNMVIIFVILEIEKTIGLCARIHVRMNRLGELA